MKRKIALLIVLCIGVVFCLCACHIEDKNGPDDYSLVEITDEKILKNTTSYTQTGAVASESQHEVEFDCRKFSGVKTLKKITYTGGIRLEINYDIELDSGNFRAVLIHDGEIVMDLPIGENQQIVIDSPKRSYEIKIAGESADVEIELEYKITENSPVQ